MAAMNDAGPCESTRCSRARRSSTATTTCRGSSATPGALRLRRASTSPTDLAATGLHTDMPRLRRGGVGAQFWSVYVPCTLAGEAAVTATLEQIDACTQHGRPLPRRPRAGPYRRRGGGGPGRRAGSPRSSAWRAGTRIDCSLGTLRMMHALGARYLTLTHFRNTPWADSATDEPGGGRAVRRSAARWSASATGSA